MADKIAFLGLGSMGAAMAANLLRAGFPLTVYNRSADKAEPLRRQGATVAPTPAEAVREASIVFTMVTDDQALEEITTGPEGILSALPPAQSMPRAAPWPRTPTAAWPPRTWRTARH
ncbi:MAG: NAD(P)-binding domain-containing protein [Hymenobacter sp.]